MNIEDQIKQANDELEKLKQDFHDRTAPVHARLIELHQQFALEHHGVKVGSTVTTRRDETFRVIKIENRYASKTTKPWVWGVKLKKNGEFGTAERALYSDWNLKTEPTVTTI